MTLWSHISLKNSISPKGRIHRWLFTDEVLVLVVIAIFLANPFHHAIRLFVMARVCRVEILTETVNFTGGEGLAVFACRDGGNDVARENAVRALIGTKGRQNGIELALGETKIIHIFLSGKSPVPGEQHM
jgi:hypothetical protein